MPDYRKAARRAAIRHGINPDIFERQIGAESNFDPTAGSPAGARGIAQFMPATAKGMGVNLDDGRAADDLDGAARLMANHLRKYGNYKDALVAYNAGPGRVGKPLYRETQGYIERILGGRNPQSAPSATPQRQQAAPQSAPNALRGATPGDSSGAMKQALLASFLRAQGQRGPMVSMLEQGLLGANLPEPEPPTLANSVMRTTKVPRHAADVGDRIDFTPRGEFKGTKGIADQFAKIGMDLGLKSTSEKRNNQNPYSGSRSDHDFANRDAYAYDLSDGDRPTPAMDRAAYRIARQLGIKDYKMGQPIMQSVEQGNVRVQVIYRGSGPKFGGNHMDHVHVGVKRIR